MIKSKFTKLDYLISGYLYKKRIKHGNKGKSGGLRTIIAYRHQDKAFLIHGYSKNDKENLSHDELIFCKQTANLIFSYNEQQLLQAIMSNIITEVKYG